jgi:hypothetical protein
MMIGMGLSLGSMMRSGFSPASLFAGGTEGAWLDRSDLPTLFQDRSGTTPVTAANQLDALKLDKSQGLVLGPELVTNGTFPVNTAGWTTAGSGVSLASVAGRLVISTPFANGGARQTITTVVGVSYKFTFSWLETTSPGNTDVTTGAGSSPIINTSNYGNYSFIFTAISTSTVLSLNISGGDSYTATYDNISVRLLPGNHAVQPTSGLTSRYQVSPFRSQYDGADDFSATPFLPTAAGTIAVRMNSTTASKVAFGSQPASNGRCYIALASDGSLAGGIGTQATAVIKGSTDIRGIWTTGILTWDGTTVTLYQDGVSVYSAAQSGAVNTTIAMHEGALNNNGTASSFTAGGIAQSIVLDRVMTASEIANITTLWSNIS